MKFHFKSYKSPKRKLERMRVKSDFYQSIPKYIRINKEYKHLKNQKIEKIRRAKKHYQNKINQTLQKSKFKDKLSWRLIKQNKTSPNNIPALIHNNKTITDPINKAEILHTVLSHPEPPSLSQKHTLFHKQINSKTNILIQNICNKSHPQNPTDILNSPIKKYELINCITDLDKDSLWPRFDP